MKLLSSSLSSIALLWSTFSVAVAQVPPVPAPGPMLAFGFDDYVWPAAMGAGAFEKVVRTDLDGDLIADAVVLAGGVPIVACAPSVHEAFRHLVDGSFSARDVEPLPDVGPQGADGLLVLTSNGLQQVVLGPGGATVTTISAMPEWAAATRLRVVEVSGVTMAFGVVQAGHTVISELMSQGLWSRGPTFSTVGEIVDVAVADWDDDGTLELVVETTQALEPFELRGTPLLPLASIGTSLGIAVLPDPVGNDDRIAWIEQTSPGKTLVTANSSGRHDPHPLAFPLDGSGEPIDFAFVGVAAGDIDGDGDADLVIGQKTALYSIVLENGDDGVLGPQFDPSDPGQRMLLPLASQPLQAVAGNDCPPSVADYDGDGYADVLTARDDVRRLNLQCGLGGCPTCFVTTDGLAAEDILHPFSDFEVSPASDTLHLVLHLPLEYRNAYDYLDVAVWRQEQPGDDLAPNAVFHAAYAIVQNGGVPSEFQWLTIENGQVFPPNGEWSPQHHFYVVFRFVNLQGGDPNQLTDASPAFAFGLTLPDVEGSTTYANYLLGLPHAGGSGALVAGTGPPAEPTPNAGGRVYIGSFVIQHVLPPPPDDQPPSAGASEPTPRSMSTWDPDAYW